MMNDIGLDIGSAISLHTHKEDCMKIVFLGDSITDAGKNTEAGYPVPIGQGYTAMIAGRLGVDAPGKYEFVNSGVSGYRSTDIYSQIKCQCWNLKPDVVSLYVGVNDALHDYLEQENGVDTERFYRVVRTLLTETRERFPGVKFILLAPFALRSPLLNSYGEQFYSEVRKRAAAVQAVAQELSIPFLSVQALMDEACKLQPWAYWSADGVHPTTAGHQLIADAWLKVFREHCE